MLRAVIFDVDGTIVDSVDLHAEAWRVAFERFGKAFPFQRVRRQINCCRSFSRSKRWKASVKIWTDTVVSYSRKNIFRACKASRECGICSSD
jgi:beta-phosphoglucomutase-like phosphatase (HAD superfamily)